MSSAPLLLSMNLGRMDTGEVEMLEALPLGGLLAGTAIVRDERERQRSLLGRALLGYGLQRLTGSAEHAVELGEYGRPFLPGLPGIDFNISHSGDWILCAISKDRRVGVDVELVGEYLEDVVVRFTKAEIDYIRSRNGQERIEAFYRVWTAKEAYLKAEGDTFLTSLDQFAVTRADGSPGVRLPPDGASHGWNLFCGTIDPRHAYAICYSGGPAECAPRELHTRELLRPGNT